MEDYTLVDLEDDLEGCHVFAVFDGSEGKEVAAFCKQYFVEIFRKQYYYAKKEYK
jgi:serine/threonine protein phosphatase PrpC